LAFLQEEACQDQPVKQSEFGSYSKKNTQDSVKPPYITAPQSVKPSEDKKTNDAIKTKQSGDDKLVVSESI
jgi:hypothetical protein